LALKDIPVTILEAEEEVVKEFRGSTFHPPTLEILDDLGIGGYLIEKGIKAYTVQYRDRKEGLIAEFDLRRIKQYTRFPFRLQIDQYALALLLIEKLKGLSNVDVVFNAKVSNITDMGTYVEVSTNSPDGRTRVFRAPYVIGADGGNSIVRRSIGITFEGITYPERYITLFTPFDFQSHLPGFASVNYISDPKEWCIMLRSPDLWRVLFPTKPKETDEEVLSEETIQTRLQNLLSSEEPYPIVHKRVYKIHQRVASTYSKGRIVLAGDSAHVNNPMGGMGLNGGIHDANELSCYLKDIWFNKKDGHILKEYSSKRRHVAIQYVQKQTHQNAIIMSESNESKRRLQQAEMSAIALDPDRSLDYMLRMSMMDRSYR